MFWQIALLAGQMWLGETTRQRPKKVSFEEFQKNNAPSEVRPVPYVAGTVEVIPSRIWYGDFSQRAVERDSHWSDYLWAGGLAFLLDTITVAYRYYCGEMFALCFGPDVHVERVTIGERLMYQAVLGADNAGGGFLIDDPQAWGGDQPPGEGGQYSWCDVTRGNYTDPTNIYIESLLTTPPNKTPSLRGVSCLISRARLRAESPQGFPESGFFAAGGVGFIPRFREWKVIVRRQPNNLATAYSKMGRKANPMEVWYEHATSLEYGARCPVDELNLTSLRSCAQTLYEESNGDFTSGWSGKIENPTSPLEVCKNVLQQIDAVPEPSPSLGLTIRLIRRDYSFATLPLLNQSNITLVERYDPGTYEDTVNRVDVPFNDIDNNSTERKGVYIDAANQTIQGGRIVPQTQGYIGVGDYPTANMLATRDGRALAIPRPPLVCTVQPSIGRTRYVGEPVKFEWSQPSFSKVMRITALTPPGPSEVDYTLEMVEDQFATGARVSGEPVGTGHTDPGVGLDIAPPSVTWDTVENPPDGLAQIVLQQSDESLISYIDGRFIFGSYAPGGQFARLYVTEPGGTQTLAPPQYLPDDSSKGSFQWPALTTGTYEFCLQTYSLHFATNNVLVCAEIEVTVPDVRLLEDGSSRLLEDGVVRILE